MFTPLPPRPDPPMTHPSLEWAGPIHGHPQPKAKGKGKPASQGKKGQGQNIIIELGTWLTDSRLEIE
jgi:hypothetical protein